MTNVSVTIDKKSVFNPVYIPYLENNVRIQIYYGGSSSGKSVFLAQRDVTDVMKGGRNFLVCRQVGKTLRGSVVQEIKKIINDWGISHLFTINKTDGTVTCSNGYQIVFAGLDDVEKLKSVTPAKGVFTDVRLEEATEIEHSSVRQLLLRQRGGDENTPKRLTMSFNPIMQNHWIYSEFFSSIKWTESQKEYRDDRLSILKTTYKDNRFLTPEDIRDLEGIEDKYYRTVYVLGNWGVLGNTIFKNWTVEDLSEMRAQFTNRRNGLDFGFSSDPAAMPVTHYDKKHKTIYIFAELYEFGMTNNLLAAAVKKLIGNDLVVCDSAEPKSIEELRTYGVKAVGAVKGPDSVMHGIQWLQQQKFVIDLSCINSKNNIMQYKWKEDKDGKPMPIPLGKNDHIPDALRYGYEGDMIESPGMVDQPERQSIWTGLGDAVEGRSRWRI